MSFEGWTACCMAKSFVAPRPKSSKILQVAVHDLRFALLASGPGAQPVSLTVCLLGSWDWLLRVLREQVWRRAPPQYHPNGGRRSFVKDSGLPAGYEEQGSPHQALPETQEHPGSDQAVKDRGLSVVTAKLVKWHLRRSFLKLALKEPCAVGSSFTFADVLLAQSCTAPTAVS